MIYRKQMTSEWHHVVPILVEIKVYGRSCQGYSFLIYEYFLRSGRRRKEREEKEEEEEEEEMHVSNLSVKSLSLFTN